MIRTTKTTVTFRRPFHLGSLEEVLTPGIYKVEMDEELLEGLSFPAYRRVLTVIHLHEQPAKPGLTRVLKIEQKELDAALVRDRTPGAEKDTLPAGCETAIRLKGGLSPPV